MRKISIFFCSLFISNLFATPPKLIVQIVVDQLRGDLIQQHQTKFGPAGFNYLLKHSLNFQNAHHPHANTVTCVGHATIATGSYPALHGIVANTWFNRQTHHHEYCVKDKNSPILMTSPNQKKLAGRSPINIVASTFSDELVLANLGRAFGVSLKDRAAITLAGHAGKAFWFDKRNGGFITSQFYYSSYPTWVTEWNQNYHPKELIWNLSKPQNNYSFKDVPAVTHRFPEFGMVFPHSTGPIDSKYYYKHLSMIPIADQLTADFAITLLQHEKLGQVNKKTDYLGISFSVVDGIGHQFGPNSMEAEDNLLHLDETLTRLLKAIDKQVGLKNTLIVLTADHGITDSPNYLQLHQIKFTAPVNKKQLRSLLVTTLERQFNLPESTVQSIELPYIYLDHEIINDSQYSLEKITETLLTLLRQQPGIFQAYALPMMDSQPRWLSEKVGKMSYLNRAGDIYIVPPPYQSRGEKAKLIHHGSPWEYDTFVPLLFVNGNFKEQRFVNPVFTTDIASTLSALLRIKAPSASTGVPLVPVITAYDKK